MKAGDGVAGPRKAIPPDPRPVLVWVGITCARGAKPTRAGLQCSRSRGVLRCEFDDRGPLEVVKANRSRRGRGGVSQRTDKPLQPDHWRQVFSYGATPRPRNSLGRQRAAVAGRAEAAPRGAATPCGYWARMPPRSPGNGTMTGERGVAWVSRVLRWRERCPSHPKIRLDGYDAGVLLKWDPDPLAGRPPLRCRCGQPGR